MKLLLIKTIESQDFSGLVFLQGSIHPEEAYPDRFVTYFTLDGSDAAHFDDAPVGTAWRYQVINYATDAEVLMQDAANIRAALREAGFIPAGRGRDIPSDVSTHTGWANEYYFLEMEE